MRACSVGRGSPNSRAACVWLPCDRRKASTIRSRSIFSSKSSQAWSPAFDAKWDAAVPFTMLIAPGGKVLFQQQGEVDIVALRRVILANLENETYVGHPAYWATR